LALRCTHSFPTRRSSDLGYGVELAGKKLTLVGHGRLIGAPLAKLWRSNGYNVTVLDDQSGDITPIVRESDVIVTATGVPRLITRDRKSTRLNSSHVKISY